MSDHGVTGGHRSTSGCFGSTSNSNSAGGSRQNRQVKQARGRENSSGFGILRSREFDLVFRTGLRVQGELVRLLFLRRPDDGIKLGCAVGKRQGKAHVRSRGRRVLREAFRHVAPWIVPDISFVLSLKDRGLDAKATEICADLVRILKRKSLLLDSFHGVDWNAPVRIQARVKATQADK